MGANFHEILDFWFKEIKEEFWWKKDFDFDETIRRRFYGVHHKASCCELFSWRMTPEGSLAEIIILDQFSRNMFRGKPESFKWDSLALALAQESVHKGFDRKLEYPLRLFIYMPYMHSESVEIHTQAVKLFSSKELSSSLEYELKHKEIIDRFGRYPHRNVILGRESTFEELEFLKQPGSSF